MVAIFADCLLEGKSPTIFGDGEQTRDYIYVGDVAAANRAVLEADLRGHPDPVFNVSTGASTSVNRLCEMLRAAMGAAVEAAHAPPRPGDVEHSLLDNAKLHRLLDWQPTIALEEGLMGKPAALRVAELGGPDYTRQEIEAFREILRDDPERWVRIMKSVDVRTSELRARKRAAP